MTLMNSDIEFLDNQISEGQLVIEEDGAGKWKSNNRYIPDDCAEYYESIGTGVNREATRIKRDIETKKFFAEYRKRMENHVYSQEELSEMRNAFGEGEVVVNVITGERIRL